MSHAAVLLLLVASSCARRVKPDTPVPEPQVAPQPGPAQPAAKPTPEPARRPAPAAAPAPGARATASAAAGKVAPPAARTPAPAPTLDLTTLEAQLRATKAIGVFTKITLKNQIDDLLDRFRAYHQRTAKFGIADLRRSYDLLLMKVLSLLQDEDPGLAMAIVSSRAAIWDLLADPVKFAALKA